jgi:acyl-homoserine-lactone acylase
MKHLFLLLFIPLYSSAQAPQYESLLRWQKHARDVTIIRDNYGIPHIYCMPNARMILAELK